MKYQDINYQWSINHIAIQFNDDIKMSRKWVNDNHPMIINVQLDNLMDTQLQHHDQIIKYQCYEKQYRHNMSLQLMDLRMMMTKLINRCEILYNIWSTTTMRSVTPEIFFECKCKDNGCHHWFFWSVTVSETRKERGYIAFL